MPTHGEYVAGKGWYSAVHNGYFDKADKIGRIVEAPKVHSGHAAEVAAWGRKNTFQQDPQMERMIALRDSDKPRDQSAFDSLIKNPSLRTSLAGYEAQKAGEDAS